VVLNTLTDYDFQDEFKKNDSAYARKGNTSRVVVASGPKLSF
jgi:hypothetical protein